ncbi:MAG: hypothetical protein QNJ97_11455 [Myxococcota bacterium]|nr:hypothetical protein [Myxococcota bacterium]
MIGHIDLEKWTKSALDMARFSIETSVRNLELVQEQTNKAVDFAMTAAGQLQKETQNAYHEWQKTADQARRMYVESLENGLEMMSKTFSPPSRTEQPKSRK